MLRKGGFHLETAKKIGKKVADFLGYFIPSVSFTIIFVVFIASIVCRYFLKRPLTWSYEISVLGYMWTMFFGVGKAIKADEHVVFGLVYDTLKPKAQFFCMVLYNAALVVLLCIVFIPCFNTMIGKQMVTGVLKLPYTVVFAPFMYMLAEIIIRSVLKIKEAYEDYKNIKGGIEA